MEQNVKHGYEFNLPLLGKLETLFSRNAVIGFVFLARLFCISEASAQKHVLSKKQVMQHVQTGIEKNFHPDSLLLSKFCRSSCIFIKFNVDANGYIKNITFSKDSTSFIQNALEVAVKSLQKDIGLMSALKHSRKTIIQPFIYEYQAGCNLGRSKDSFGSASQSENKPDRKSEAEVLFEANHINRALLDMLNFNGKPLTEIDCLLLTPMLVSSGAMY
nr:hypothetical protein [uncultured Mucilaginibacter sp.]